MRKFAIYCGALFAIAFLGVVGYAIYTVRSDVPIVGHTILTSVNITFIALIVSVIGLPLVGLLIFLKWFLRPEYYEMGQWGGYVRWFNRFKPLQPLLPAQPKVAGTSVTEVQPNIPRLAELIRDGLLVKEEAGQALMLQGFRADETPRYGEWPGVIAITGMQNVGKTVTMLTLIIIALLQGAHVVVCDTHHSKARSLFKKIEALKGYITFATTEEEVLRETRRFSDELRNRKNGSNPYPYVLFYDELCSLIRARNEELREALPTVMEEGSQEGHGYGLHIVAAIHDISNTGIGDARLRGFWNFVYCHRMEQGQSKFIEAFKGKYGKQKTSMLIAGLPAGHTMTRDEVNEIEYLIMPMGDSRDVLIAKEKIGVAGTLEPVSTASPLSPRSEIKMLRESERVKDVKKPVAASEIGETFTEQEPTMYERSEPGRGQTKVLAREEEPSTAMQEQEEEESTFDDPQLEMAYQLFTHGTTTARDVGTCMGIGKDKANALLNTLQAMEYIQR